MGVVHAYSKASYNTAPTVAIIGLAGLVLMVILPSHFRCAVFVLTTCAFGTLFAHWLSR